MTIFTFPLKAGDSPKRTGNEASNTPRSMLQHMAVIAHA